MHEEQKEKNLELEFIRTKEELAHWKSNYDDFINLASHDLLAPIRKITTLLDRFNQKTKDKIPEEAKVYLERVNKSLDVMTTLINDLLRLSSIKSNDEILSEVNLNDLLKNVIAPFNEIIQNKKIQLSISELPIVCGNKEQLKMLFTELITNAIKFGRKEITQEITVTYSRLNEEEKLIYNLSPKNSYVSISIHDNGIGFNNDDAQKITRPFQRLHGNSEYTGNGIGLSICKKIVEANSGFLNVEGKENEGATFSVILCEIQTL